MSHSHAPRDYDCPMCQLGRGETNELNRRDHIVYQDATTLAYVSPKFWVNNPGNLLVIPKLHYENLYDIPDELLADVYRTVKKMAIAMRESYPCEGTSTRQHNEPAGNQNIWHLHVHVYPRYTNDQLYERHAERRWVTDAERMVYVRKLREYLGA